MTDVLSLAWERYERSLRRAPLQTKSATSACLSALSNITAQRLVSNAPLNWRRAFAMAVGRHLVGRLSGQRALVFGYFVTAPATHYWHKFLEKLFPSSSKDGRTDDLSPLKKVLLDVFTFGPILNAAALSYISMVVDGRSVEFTKQKLEKDYPSVVLNAWKVWPIIHFINYKYIQPQLRVPFVSAASFFWSVFLILRAKGSLSVK